MRRIRWELLPQLQSYPNFLHARMGHGSKQMANLKARNQDCMLGVVALRFLPIPEFLSWFFFVGLCIFKVLGRVNISGHWYPYWMMNDDEDNDGQILILILQPFRRFTYVTAHSPTLLSLFLRHSSFSNPFSLLLCHRLFTWRAAHVYRNCRVLDKITSGASAVLSWLFQRCMSLKKTTPTW